MVYYGFYAKGKIANVVCYETVENVPEDVLNEWNEITEEQYNSFVDRVGTLENENITPSQFDIIEAQVMYTALMTDTLIESEVE